MKNQTFMKVLICIIALCLALTIAHLVYVVYAYHHSSIIQFIAKELW